MKMQNKIVLITYADSLGKDISQLERIVDTYLHKAIGSIHILPFYPSSADRGFAPITYQAVDKKFGSFSDLKRLSKKYELIYDFMVNHISASSEYFLDFKEKKEGSKYKDMFIRYVDFWINGEPTTQQIDMIYKRKPKAPYIEITFADGTTEKVWCTFGDEQIDLNLSSDITRDFIRENLILLCKNGASVIRLDAFAYAVKRKDTSCFFVEPDVWDLLYEIKSIVEPYNVEILPEIHEHYSIQKKLSDKGFMVYDFALPMLVLHAIYSHRGDKLKHWIDICPRNQMTTLDTHDGIGIVDAADLLTDEDIEQTKEALYANGANIKKKYSGGEYNNLDIYQINCSYYSALGNNDKAYLLARAIQFFTPGVPQVYYMGMMAGENDLQLLETTKEGRNINRHYYSEQEVIENLKRSVVEDLKKLMIFRNEFPAFDGDCKCTCHENKFTISRSSNGYEAVLNSDLATYEFSIETRNKNEVKV